MLRQRIIKIKKELEKTHGYLIIPLLATPEKIKEIIERGRRENREVIGIPIKI